MIIHSQSRWDFWLQWALYPSWCFQPTRNRGIVFSNQNDPKVNEIIKIYLNSDAGSSASAKVYLVFLNKGLFKNDKKQQSSKTPSSLIKSGSKTLNTEILAEKDSGNRVGTPSIDSGKKKPSQTLKVQTPTGSQKHPLKSPSSANKNISGRIGGTSPLRQSSSSKTVPIPSLHNP